MARHVLECRAVFPQSGCTLLFVGEAEEVIKVFSTHAVDAHGREARTDLPGVVDAARRALQAAVFVGDETAYIGDTYMRGDDGEVTVPGPGFVMQRINSPTGVDVTCSCLPADGKCDMQYADGHADQYAGSADQHAPAVFRPDLQWRMLFQRRV